MHTRLLISFAFLALVADNALCAPLSTTTPNIVIGSGSATIASAEAEYLCMQLSQTFQPPSGITINNTFTQYFPEGSTASIEFLTDSYPNGTIPAGVDKQTILEDVGPDLNVRSQAGYGYFNSFASQQNGMPAFCRFVATIITGSNTSALSEVWLPLASNPFIPLATPEQKTNQSFLSILIGKLAKRNWSWQVRSLPGDFVLGYKTGWNGRIAVLGNSGQLGWVPMVTMKNYMGRYMFVVAGTNLGHFSDQNGVEWVLDNFQDTLTDFASRANHLTTLLAESVVDQYYGKDCIHAVRNPKDNNRVYRYYAGTSVGGARGLSAAQIYPNDYHGIIAGAPANQFMNLNTGQLHTASLHNKSFIGEGYFSRSALYGPVKDIITRQCDALDGLQDGIISAPTLCKFQLEPELLCGTGTTYGQSNDTCLNQTQINAVYQLYNATYIDGEIIYPAYWPGLEHSASNLRGSNAKASGWHQLVVLRRPALNDSFNPFTDIRLSDLNAGIAADPGGVNAAETDLSAFISSGGKLIMYQGSYDLTVSPQATVNHFNQMKESTSASLGEALVTSSIKLYEVFGMKHSRNGIGAANFGAPQQNDDGQRPYKFESGYDITLALIAWVEKGIEPNGQIALHYGTNTTVNTSATTNTTDPDRLPPENRQDYNFGVVFSRLLCPYPAKAVYQAGANPNGENGYQAFTCV
ncbi:tannase-domain-containing protein [Meira miltonrushii]|uniref:Carboxylic ester hydrolase n=1 Tax=Meira miltonrushii TaxID=1280837 RepID=A0A316VHZ1_9BASI|nr:tannase-domain-containing protein [Meira miltonrushii]PWN35611.1 tannase-domain-containing protein [Meira miltonrushii]